MSDQELMFQSTRPRGARPRTLRARAELWCFNPRAREGRDIHPESHERLSSRFNPRAREGRDFPVLSLFPDFSRFNPRAREGRDWQ